MRDRPGRGDDDPRAGQNTDQLQPDPIGFGDPGRGEGGPKPGLAQGAQPLGQQGGVCAQAGAQQQAPQQQQAQARDPLQTLKRGGAPNIGMGKGADDAGQFAWRAEHGEHAQSHQQRRQAVGQVPSQAAGEHQGHSAGDDDGDAISPLVGGGHGALPGAVRSLDPPSVDDDVLGGRGEAGQYGEQGYGSEAGLRVAAGDQHQAGYHGDLSHQHPGPAVAQPRGQAGNGGAVDERRPEEFEGIGQGGQAEERDHFQREPGLPQPGGERVEDHEVGQARGEAQGQHHQDAAVKKQPERAERAAPGRRRRVRCLRSGDSRRAVFGGHQA